MWTAIRAALKVYGVIVVLLIAALAIGWQFVAPPPPRSIVIAAGAPGGAYETAARRWAASLAREGVTAEVLATAGSVENLALVTGAVPRADIAIIQGGVSGEAAFPDLRSLGAVAYEAVWVFRRISVEGTRLRDLAGTRIAIGPEGSGTRALALSLMQTAGLETATTLPLGGMEAAEALLAGEADAALFVSAAPTPAILRLLGSEAVALIDFAPRAEAYLAAFPFLSAVRLHAGSADLAEDLPREAATLLAPVAQVVVRDGIHPQIVLLLMETLKTTLGGRQFFAPAGTFPAAGPTDWALHDDAARYYRFGPGFLKRYLPFWVAVTIERTWVLLIPLLTLLLPLSRIAPPLYRWQIERKIYRWYRDVRRVEEALESEGEAADRAGLVARLDRVSARVAATHVPLAFARPLYDLRQHIAFVRERVTSASGRPQP
ncbi:MAG: ABC transporter substrate-binding protein [Acetobacteraceae bacterium]|jgi:TRAP transporter TAXI family solute receptor|nr:ABC transporter substrate-binding protein [Acetobacteraceae bacterium]